MNGIVVKSPSLLGRSHLARDGDGQYRPNRFAGLNGRSLVDGGRGICIRFGARPGKKFGFFFEAADLERETARSGKKPDYGWKSWPKGWRAAVVDASALTVEVAARCGP